MRLDWLNGVGIPAVLAVITVVGLYLRDPNTPELRNPKRFAWSAVAAGVVWAVIRGIADYRQEAIVTWTPVLGGLVAVAVSVAVRWVLLRAFGRRAGQHKRR
jgi:hypothetical protein